MNEEELRAFRTRFGIPISDAEVGKTPFYRPAEDSIEIKYMREKRKALGGYVPTRKVRAEALQAGLARAVRGVPQGHRRPQGVDDDGVRAAAVEAAARQGDRPPRRADRARRSAHLRHGSAVPPGRHLLARRPDLRAGRHGHAALLQGSVATARFSRKGSTRPDRCRRSSPPAPPTPRTASTRSRSSSTTRCSASSASAT